MTQSIGAFVDGTFFPELKQRVRQSAYVGYVHRWESQLKARCADVRLRDFRALTGQKLIGDIHRQSPKMKYSSLAHLKKMLSLIFDEADRLELLTKAREIR